MKKKKITGWLSNVSNKHFSQKVCPQIVVLDEIINSIHIGQIRSFCSEIIFLETFEFSISKN